MTMFLIRVSGRTGGRQQTPAEARSAPGTVVSSLWMDVLTDELVKRTLVPAQGEPGSSSVCANRICTRCQITD
jgi:hypothetical protein